MKRNILSLKSVAGSASGVFLTGIFFFDLCIAGDTSYKELIAAEANVVYNRTEWLGVHDLSFKYSIHQKNDTITFIITVRDNQIVAKPGKIVSDHIEIRIADPALSVKMLDSKHCSGETDNELFIHRFPKVFPNAGVTHFIISPGSVICLPHRCSFTRPIVEYRYLNDTVYAYRVSIPLPGVIDMLTDSLEALSYLIEVIDVDSTGASMMKCCMSSSPGRIYSSAQTFKKIRLAPVHLDIPYYGVFRRIQPVGAVLPDSGKLYYWAVAPDATTGTTGHPVCNLVKCRRETLYADSIITIWKCLGALGFTDSLINYVIKYSEYGPRPRYQLLDKVTFEKSPVNDRRIFTGNDAVPFHECWKPVGYGACAVEGIEYIRIDTSGIVISTEAFDITRCAIPEDGLIEKIERTDGAYVAFLFDNFTIKTMQRIVFMKDYPDLGSLKVTLDTNL